MISPMSAPRRGGASDHLSKPCGVERRARRPMVVAVYGEWRRESCGQLGLGGKGREKDSDARWKRVI